MQFVNRIKKASLLTAAVAVGLSFTTAAHAGTLPYKSSFEPVAPASDSPQTNYTQTNLAGQGGFADLNSTGNVSVVATPPSGSPANGSQVVKIQTLANNADHNFATDYASSDNIYSGTSPLYITFDASHGAQTATGSASRFGIDILNSTQTAVLASFMLGEDPTRAPGDQATMYVNDVNGAPSVPISYNTNFDGGVPRQDGQWGTYTLKLDLVNDKFTVYVAGNNHDAGTYAFAGSSGGLGIGGIAFASPNDGSPGNTDVAYFDNLSVVPEPAMFSMIGVGAMMLLSKRPRRA